MDDLREERQVVVEAIEAIGGLEWKSVMAGSYGSQPFSSREACRRMLEECAIYLGVYGHRYEWIIADEGVSVSSPRIVLV